MDTQEKTTETTQQVGFSIEGAGVQLKAANEILNLFLKLAFFVAFVVITFYAYKEGIVFLLLEGVQPISSLAIVAAFAFFTVCLLAASYAMALPFGVIVVLLIAWVPKRILGPTHPFRSLKLPEAWWVWLALGLGLNLMILLTIYNSQRGWGNYVTMLGCGALFVIFTMATVNRPLSMNLPVLISLGSLALFVAFIMGDLFRPVVNMSLSTIGVRSGENERLVFSNQSYSAAETAGRLVGISLKPCPFGEDRKVLINARIVWRFPNGTAAVRVYNEKDDFGFVLNLPVETVRIDMKALKKREYTAEGMRKKVQRIS